MAKARVRKNDIVAVISGKDRGKRGRVLRVMTEKGLVMVEGVNIVKRHTKPNPQRNVKGGIVERETPIHLSNVTLIDPEIGSPDPGRYQGARGRPASADIAAQRRGAGKVAGRDAGPAAWGAAATRRKR